MKNITSKVSRDDMDNARIDRNRKTNPAEVEPGMDDFEGWDTEDSDFGGFGDSTGWGTEAEGRTNFSSGVFGNIGNNPSSLGGFGTFGQQDKKEDIEDKFWGGVKKLGLGFFTFIGELVKSFKTFDAFKRVKTGKSISITGGLHAVVGFILLLFGFGNSGLNLIIGGLTSVGIGVPLFMFSYEEIMGSDDQKVDGHIEHQFNEDDLFNSFEDVEDSTFGFGSEDDEYDMFTDEDDDDSESFDFNFEEDTTYSAFDVDFEDVGSDVTSDQLDRVMEDVVENLNDNNGMLTRQYLYDNITSCLMNHNKNYDKVREIREGTDEFDAWDAIIQSSANILKTSKTEEDMPYLIEAKDRLFYTQLEVKRVSWLKNVDAFVTEIVNICRFDRETGRTDLSIYGVGETVGGSIFIKVMKGESALVTIKDTYKAIESDIKDTKNYLPVILGLNPEGDVIWRDFKDINSLLVTGMARSGKTWFTLSIISQMTFYLRPSELNISILDPKDQISDFKAMKMPHIRKFVSTDKDILDEIRYIVRVEGARRKKIIGDAGFVNIWDFKSKNPDIELPLLYVVIDEVVTLAERMDNNTKAEFQGLLLELVSQLPALGIRLFMISHVVKDQILKKSITDLIPCRVSVKGNESHIETSLGVKNFRHKLTNQGDMAVRFNNDDPMFVRSAVLTPSNEDNIRLFDFLLKFWLKLEPESLKGSLYEQYEKVKNLGLNPKMGRYSVTIEDESSKNQGDNSQNNNSTKLSINSVNDLLRGINSED